MTQWITIKELKFFKEDGDYLIIPIGKIYKEAHRSEVPASLLNTRRSMQRFKNPNVRFVYLHMEGKIRCLVIRKDVIRYRKPR